MEILRLIRAQGVLLNSISVHNFAKVQHLKVYLAVYKFNIECLSKTYLKSSFPIDDNKMDIPRYIMARADHPANSKNRGACMYYKNCLPLKVLDIIFLHERIQLLIYEWVTNYVASFPFTDHLTNDMMVLYRF